MLNIRLEGNAVIGQSGGPTAAINATLSGVIREAMKTPEIKEIYGAKHGIDGILNENFVNLREKLTQEEDFFTLECTPAAALGSCRHRLPPIDEHDYYDKIFDILKRNNIRYIFLIGGNDSMDTVAKLSKYAATTDYDVRIIGVPKTIDNDLEYTDHTPGFGSAAKYVATAVSEIERDCSVYMVPAVTIVEIMGRDAGWLTAASAIPRLYGQGTADLVYLPEVPFDYDYFIDDIIELQKTKPNVVVAVSEGIKDEDGRYVGDGTQSGMVDNFGHKYLAGAGKILENYVRRRIGCKVRSIELSLPQRCSGHILSKCDIEESVLIGSAAVSEAVNGKSGILPIFKRKNTENYDIEIGTVPVEAVANKIKRVDKKYITERANNVTDELLHYLAPLIEGEIDIPKIHGVPKHFIIK